MTATVCSGLALVAIIYGAVAVGNWRELRAWLRDFLDSI